MPDLSDLKQFDLAGAGVSLWVFRKRIPKGGAPTYNGRWVEIGEDVKAEIRGVASAAVARIEEVIDYTHLAENHETSVLAISADETHVGLIEDKASSQDEHKRVRNESDLENIEFYVFRFVKDDEVLYAVRKTDQSWKTRKRRDLVSVFFDDHKLVLDPSVSFSISRFVDFILFRGEVYIAGKMNFESVLAYKAAHQDDFVQLQQENDFKDAFVDLDEMIKFVGDNKIHLRRLSAIREKGHYKDVEFMNNLRALYRDNGLSIVFNAEGKIVPSQETCRDIIQALLDHRLGSDFSRRKYDVQNTANVSV